MKREKEKRAKSVERSTRERDLRKKESAAWRRSIRQKSFASARVAVGAGVCVISVERNSQYDDDHGGVRQRYAQWKVEKGKERKGKGRREEKAKERGEERRRRSE